MAIRTQDTDKEARSDYFTTYQMYCERSVCNRLNRLKAKLAAKNLMFKFNHRRVQFPDACIVTSLS